jgi:hypothetical protein
MIIKSLLPSILKKNLSLSNQTKMINLEFPKTYLTSKGTYLYKV